jgi:hypothetical protein
MKRMTSILSLILLYGSFLTSCTTTVNTQEMEFEEPGTKVEKEDISTNEKTDYFNNDFIRYEDHVYVDNIKTVLLHKTGWEMSPPLIKLNAEESVTLSFDDFETEVKDYQYTLLHCNANWERSDLHESEYMEGYYQDYISDYDYSFNTFQKYTHYEVTVPNENMKVTKTGNYILLVYADNDQENAVITKRMMVFQDKLTIVPDVKRASKLDDRNYMQEIDFTIKYGTLNLASSFDNLTVVLTQNNRWDNAVNTLKPLFIKDNELVYDYDTDNVFNGGNEFRFFDIKSLRYKTDRIKAIDFDSSKYYVTLMKDEKRTFTKYYSYADLNGKFLVKIQEGNESNIEADYANVHFSLPFEAPIVDGNLYLFGGFTDWQFKKEYQLKYNYDKRTYECTAYLKQGYYNYHYVHLKDGATKGDETYIEGTHYETGNVYTIYTYFRDLTGNYDMLVGVKSFPSIR